LYKSIEDFDVLRGIFSSHIGTQVVTKEALEAEGRGDFTTALKLYSQVRITESDLILNIILSSMINDFNFVPRPPVASSARKASHHRLR
jgi:hypothetical protein